MEKQYGLPLPTSLVPKDTGFYDMPFGHYICDATVITFPCACVAMLLKGNSIFMW